MFEINKVIFEYISEPFHNPACSSLFENILSESTLGLGMKNYFRTFIKATSFILYGDIKIQLTANEYLLTFSKSRANL